jgi:rhamnogalacturonyl hydrolase YesR
MAPPFLAVMGEVEEAVAQIEGYMDYLKDVETGLLYHIYDAGTDRFVRKVRWATGNGWALLGIARVAETAFEKGMKKQAEKLVVSGREILDGMLRYQLPDGRFHDILDEPDSFVEGTGAMMMATYIYRGMVGGWLPAEYTEYAERVRVTMEDYVDEIGLIREVCGCPHFLEVGTSAESMAAYLMMHGWYGKWKDK